MNLQLRRAQAADQPALAAMLVDHRRELGSPPDDPWLALYAQAPDRHAYLLQRDGDLVGFALLRDLDADANDTAEVTEVAELYVHPSVRRQGLGRLALRALRRLYPQAWSIEVFADRDEALRFWRRELARTSVERALSATGDERRRIAFRVPADFHASAALGVPGGTVRLAAHAPAWSALFAQEAWRIAVALGTSPQAVQHVGSTAVPGLQAKPIVDIAIGLGSTQDIARAVPRLEAIGYRDLGVRSTQIGRLLERIGPRGRTHCIHLLESASPHYGDYLLVRDHLRSNVAARTEYQVVKRALAAEHAHDRRGYTAAKNAAVSQLIAQARARRAILAAAGLSFPLERARTVAA